MKANQNATKTLPDTVNTFGQLSRWLANEVEQVRTDLRAMFDDLVKQGVFAQDRDYLSGPIGSLNFFDDQLRKSGTYRSEALFLKTFDLVNEMRHKTINRFAEITQSHIQEIGQTYPGLELRVSMFPADNLYFSLSMNGVDFRSEREMKTRYDDYGHPGVSDRIEEIRKTFRSFLKQNAFPANSNRNKFALLVSDGIVESPHFPQKQDTRSGIQSDGWSRILGQIETLMVKMKENNLQMFVADTLKGTDRISQLALPDLNQDKHDLSFSTGFFTTGLGKVLLDGQSFGKSPEYIRFRHDDETGEQLDIQCPEEQVSINVATSRILGNIVAYIQNTYAPELRPDRVDFSLDISGGILINIYKKEKYGFWSVPEHPKVPESPNASKIMEHEQDRNQDQDEPGPDC